jgi:hypothetical protein
MKKIARKIKALYKAILIWASVYFCAIISAYLIHKNVTPVKQDIKTKTIEECRDEVICGAIWVDHVPELPIFPHKTVNDFKIPLIGTFANATTGSTIDFSAYSTAPLDSEIIFPFPDDYIS